MDEKKREDTEMLVSRAVEGDQEALEQLLTEVQDLVFNLSLRMLGTIQDAEDASQEILIRVMTNLASFRGESAFSTWVYRVTASCCMDAIRKRQRHEQPSLEEMGEASGFDPADGGETPQEQTERKETRSAIRQAIAAVPEGMREVFLLRDVHGLSVEETAQALQIAQGTVKSRLARAREKIAAELKRRGVGQTGGERHAV